MSSLASIKTQIQTLITLANNTTGNSDTSLTACVNSLIAGYGQSSEPVPLFTNLMNSTGSTVKSLSRYSLSGGAFKSHTADSIVVRIECLSGSHILRIRGVADDPNYMYLYYGESSRGGESFTSSLDGTYGEDENGDYYYTFSTGSNLDGYVTCTVAKGAVKDDIIVTLDEEILYG